MLSFFLRKYILKFGGQRDIMFQLMQKHSKSYVYLERERKNNKKK